MIKKTADGNLQWVRPFNKNSEEKMQKLIKIITITSLILSFGLTSGVMAADVAKIGVFDYQRFLQKSDAGQKIRGLLNSKKTQFETKLKQKKAEVQKLREQLEREAMVMSPEKQEEKVREHRIKINDYNALEARYTKEIKFLEFQESKKLFKQVSDILNKIGKDGNYLLIVHQNAVLYAPNQIDITDTVIKKHNKKFATNG